VRLIGINLYRVIPQDAFPFSVDVVELTIAQRPGKNAQNDKYQDDGQRNQQEEDVHGGPQAVCGTTATEGITGWVAGLRVRRRALPTTSNELAAMPMPASQGGSQPISASGTPARL
jgi:hypothetical protein